MKRKPGKKAEKKKKASASKKKKTTAHKKKTRLSSAELRKFKQMLLEKRREILGDVNEMQDEVLDKPRLDAAGDLSSMPIHMADVGTDNYAQEFSLNLMDSERKLIKEIDNALMRIENKTYGICEGTGKPIPKARLKVRPWARYRVEYARKIEQGLVEE